MTHPEDIQAAAGPTRSSTKIGRAALGPLQMAIMQEMWRGGEATVRQMTELLRNRGHRLATTTVLTVMTRLARRGLLGRRLVGRSHVYRAMVSEEDLAAAISRQAVDQLIDLHGEAALSAFAAHVKEADPETLARLRRMLGEQE